MLARLAWCSLWLLLIAAEARAEPLRIDRSAEKMRVDGALREWRGAHFKELGSGDDARIRFALASADGGLYVGVEIYDELLVTGDRGDTVVLSLAMPRDKGVHASEVSLHPGRGQERARALLALDGGAPRAETRIPVVEGPLARGQGYVVEAFIPWGAVPGSERWQEGRAVLRFVDVDGKNDSTTLRSATETRPAELPKIALGVGQEDLLGSFLNDHDLVGIAPRHDWRENVSGDERPERVVLIGQYVVVFGPGFKDGASYSYHILPFPPDRGLKSAALSDLNGDGRRELIVSGRQQNDLGAREAWLVLRLDELGLAQLFGIELSKEVKGGLIENTLTLVPARGKTPPRFEQKVGRAIGLDATTFREQPASDLQPVLLPWGEVTSRTFGWDGKSYTLLEEKKRPATNAPMPAPTTTIVQPVASDDRGALIAAFKEQQGLPASAQPTQSLRANVLGGSAHEQLDVFGRVLLFTGPDVGGGSSFVSYGAPVNDAKDLLEVRASDVTSDGQAEILLRVRQPLGGANNAERELLIVLRGDAQGRFTRILAAEIARRMDARSIENQLELQGGALSIKPGKARGWAQDSYPFRDEASGGAARLLLPWLDKTIRYRYSGGALVP